MTVRALLGTPDRPELVFRRSYRSSPAQVLRACTDVERLARWFGRVDGDPGAVGDAFTATLSEAPDDVARGRVLRCTEDEVVVAWSWQDEPESEIAVRVAAGEDGETVLTLHHGLAAREYAVGYGGGWEQSLAALARSVESADSAVAVGDGDAQVEAAAVDRWRVLTRADLVLTQHVAAPPVRVWDAFATADGLASWWWRHWSDVEVEADARVGGRYRIAAPGAGIGVDGVYLAVEPERRLAFTWRWLDDDGASVDEAVEVTFEPEGDGTAVRVRHTGPWADDAPVDSYRLGWETTLGQLVQVLG